jgi:hypothetical protein
LQAARLSYESPQVKYAVENWLAAFKAKLQFQKRMSSRLVNQSFAIMFA